MKPNSRKAYRTKALANAKDQEEKLTSKLSLLNTCKKEVAALLLVVNKKGFSSDLGLQKEAALLYRGIHQRIMVMDAAAELNDNKDLTKCLQILSHLRMEYSQIFNRIPVDVTSDGRPLIIEIERQGYHKPSPSDSTG